MHPSPDLIPDTLIDNAHDALLRLQPRQAVMLCQQTLASSDLNPLTDAQASRLYEIFVDSLILESDYASAVIISDTWQKGATTPDGRAAALVSRANLMLRQGYPAESLVLIDEALTITATSGNRAINGKAFRIRADVFWTQGHPERALFLLQQALAIHEVVGDVEQQIGVLVSMGLVYDSLNRTYDAIQICEKAIALCQASHNDFSLMVVYNNIGELYQFIYATDKALNYHQKALALSGSMPNIGLDRNLGVELIASGKRDEGLFHLRRAVQLGETGDRDELLQALYSLADGLSQIGETDEAERIAQRLLTEARQMDSERHIARVSLLLGYISIAQGKPEVANRFFQEAFIYGQRTGDKKLLWQTHAAIAEKFAESRPILAQLHLDTAVELLREMADGLPDPVLRAGFKAAPPVARILKKASALIGE